MELSGGSTLAANVVFLFNKPELSLWTGPGLLKPNRNMQRCIGMIPSWLYYIESIQYVTLSVLQWHDAVATKPCTAKQPRIHLLVCYSPIYCTLLLSSPPHLSLSLSLYLSIYLSIHLSICTCMCVYVICSNVVAVHPPIVSTGCTSLLGGPPYTPYAWRDFMDTLGASVPNAWLSTLYDRGLAKSFVFSASIRSSLPARWH